MAAVALSSASYAVGGTNGNEEKEPTKPAVRKSSTRGKLPKDPKQSTLLDAWNPARAHQLKQEAEADEYFSKRAQQYAITMQWSAQQWLLKKGPGRSGNK